ncbi:MAG TPA: trypsin-like peptidase domain-containing protein [Terriglobia bacterium]|nr:trypsin-like peptidase domain-containing protein [Terriglobia bacterium]
MKSVVKSVVKRVALIVALFAAPHPGTAAERARSVPEATGFIQVIGDYHREIRSNGLTDVVDRSGVQIAGGTGFVVSPHGYVLTNHHVIREGETVAADGDSEIRTTTRISRIQICLPAPPGTPRGVRVPCAQASVYFSDPDMDLAVLYMGGSDLPYLALGDSDVVAPGQGVDVWGYPFGGKLEIGREAALDTAPGVSATTGSVAALRGDDTGDVRFIQINANVNPGNSGGPVVDRDGFVVGVTQSRLAGADGIAFAVPVNRVKTFLESHALDAVLNARRLHLGPSQTLASKGVTLRLPEEIADTAPLRTRIAGAALPAETEFRVDRVITPWSLPELERSLVRGQTFEPAVMSEFARFSPTDPGLRMGRAIGVTADKRELGMFYAILDLGEEKLVARYIGPLVQLAYNESVIRESLLSLEARPLISAPLPAVDRMEWFGHALEDLTVPVPSGWLVEPRGPSPCPGLAAPASSFGMSPAQDFTVALRMAIWPGGEFTPAQGAAACSDGRGRGASGAYAQRQEWLGVSYVIEGLFVTLGSTRIVRLEALAPESRSAYARAALEAWARKLQ